MLHSKIRDRRITCSVSRCICRVFLSSSNRRFSIFPCHSTTLLAPLLSFSVDVNSYNHIKIYTINTIQSRTAYNTWLSVLSICDAKYGKVNNYAVLRRGSQMNSIKLLFIIAFKFLELSKCELFCFQQAQYELHCSLLVKVQPIGDAEILNQSVTCDSIILSVSKLPSIYKMY